MNQVTPPDETFGQRLRRIRKARKLSGPKLGKILDISHESLYKWEKDKANPKEDDKAKLEKWMTDNWKIPDSTNTQSKNETGEKDEQYSTSDTPVGAQSFNVYREKYISLLETDRKVMVSIISYIMLKEQLSELEPTPENEEERNALKHQIKKLLQDIALPKS